jgi:hypothetical protein
MTAKMANCAIGNKQIVEPAALRGAATDGHLLRCERRDKPARFEDQHRQKAAYIYLRQSTMAQVRHHQESTKRQYALKEKARELGWNQH